MKLGLAGRSLLLLGISALLLVALTVFESALAGLSITAERWITFLGLVLLPGIGAVLGAMSLIRKEGKTLLAVAGLVMNTLFALFHLMIVLFAG